MQYLNDFRVENDGSFIDRKVSLRISCHHCYQTRSRIIIPTACLQGSPVVFQRDREKIREGTFLRGGTLAHVVVSILIRHPPVLPRKRYLGAKSRSLRAAYSQ